MNKKLIFAAIAAISLSSCSKDNLVSNNNNTENGVHFGVLNNKVNTKATEITVANISKFSVYAYKHNKGSAATYTEEKPYYNGVSISVDNVGACTYTTSSDQKMWPKTEELDFLAYAPLNSVTYSKGVITADLSTKLNASDQTDVVVAKSINEAGYGKDNYKTTMNFHHAYSQIKFKALSKYASVNFVVKSIRITGVSTKGTADLTTWTAQALDGVNNKGNGLGWTKATTGNVIDNVVFGVKANQTINTSPIDITDDNGALMLMPQVLLGGTPITKSNTVEQILANKTQSYIVIEYSATDKESGTVLVENGRCAAPISTDLQAGLRYVYSLTLAGNGDGGAVEDKLYPIDFTCTVEGWIDSTIPGVEL